jgi:GNAT superfamily N-acetyltransferase
METAHDAWLTNLLPYDAYRLSVPLHCSPEALRDYLQNIKDGFYYVKLATDAMVQLQELQLCGFRVIDVNVTLEREPLSEEGGNHPDCQIGEFNKEHHDCIAEIAESCFVYSRFHLDPRISNEVANRIKREWVENCMSGARGDRLWVAQWDGKTVGFLAEMNLQQNGVLTAVIDLVGVGRQHQGQGIGRTLVENVLCSTEADRVRVGTQAANVPSLRLYENAGFRIVETQYVLHGHFDKGALN